MKNVALILPAFNEEKTISKTILSFSKIYKKLDIWVIDNCSSDQTNKLASRCLKKHNITGGVIKEDSKGKGNAVKRAFSDLNYDYYVLCDADLTYPPEQLEHLLKPVIHGNADMVIGSRIANGVYAAQNKRLFHNFGNNLIRSVVNLAFGSKLSDILSGYRVFNRKFIKNYHILRSGFEIETDMTVHALFYGYNITEVPINYINRPDGSESKLNTYTDGLKILFLLFNLFRYYKPLIFFSLLSVIFLSSGLVLSAPIFTEYLNSGLVPKLPSAILSGFLVILAALLFLIGLVLDSISQLDRKNHELMKLNFIKNTTNAKNQNK